MSSTRTLTLADAAWPRAGFLEHALLVFAASLLTALAAQIALPLPWTPVPLTGQSFGVLLCGALLGARRGFLAQIVYLAEGAAGMPVFAGGAAGTHVFFGPTAGYLFAFPIAAAVTGALAERGWDRRFATMLAAMLLGSLAILGVGAGLLARFVPAGSVLAAGVLPFAIGDVVKAALAAFAFPVAWRALRRRDASHGGGRA